MYRLIAHQFKLFSLQNKILRDHSTTKIHSQRPNILHIFCTCKSRILWWHTSYPKCKNTKSTWLTQVIRDLWGSASTCSYTEEFCPFTIASEMNIHPTQKCSSTEVKIIFVEKKNREVDQCNVINVINVWQFMWVHQI